MIVALVVTAGLAGFAGFLIGTGVTATWSDIQSGTVKLRTPNGIEEFVVTEIVHTFGPALPSRTTITLTQEHNWGAGPYKIRGES